MSKVRTALVALGLLFIGVWLLPTSPFNLVLLDILILGTIVYLIRWARAREFRPRPRPREQRWHARFVKAWYVGFQVTPNQVHVGFGVPFVLLVRQRPPRAAPKGAEVPEGASR